MNPETWQKLQRWLNASFELPSSERARFLEEKCPDPAMRREVLSLLSAAETSVTLLDSPPVRQVEEEVVGEVGPYRLSEKLGHGGMGTVYLARRTDDVHHREVAVKLLQFGLGNEEMIQRFEREREILAHLEHPHIARLLDGGTARDGRPYLVMERVVGQPIDMFCRQHELDVEARLRIFQKVCLAVHFAHQNLIVHRDLKPGNILVTEEGEPKLLDFGIAKLLSTEAFPVTVLTTLPGRSPMTPSWASPEQMRGERISTASDIYSLGVLLYLLLTEQHPYELDGLSHSEAMQVVCEREPTRPSAARSDQSSRRRLHGDLDHIVLKALRKDPQQRYVSAEQLVQDVDRHLQGLAVLARKGTFLYRTSKFLRRHRVAVVTTVSAFALLITFLAVTLRQQAEVTRQRDNFERIADFLIGLFDNPNPRQVGNPDLSAVELLDRGTETLTADLLGQPGVRADMHLVIGRSYHGLGRLESAAREFEHALELRRSPASEPGKVAEALAYLAQVQSDLGHFEQALAAADEALRLRRQLFRPPHLELADSLFRSAWILERTGAYDEAEKRYRQALEQARALEDPEMLGEILTSFGILLREAAAYGEAQTLLEEALELRRRHYGDRHAMTAGSLNSLGLLHDRQGQSERAERRFREALSMGREVYGEPHKATASFLANLGNTLIDQGRHEEAEVLLSEAIEMGEALYDGPHPDLATHLGLMARLHAGTARWQAADRFARRALEMRRQLFGADHKDVALSCDYLAQMLTQQKRFDEAAELFAEAVEIYRRTVGQDHPQMATSLNNRASMEYARGQKAEARRLYREALDILLRVHGEDHPEVGAIAYNLGFLHHEAGEEDPADRFYEQAEGNFRRTRGDDHPKLAFVLTMRGRIAVSRGQPEVAEESAREVIEILARSHPWEHIRRHHADVLLAESLRDQGRLDEAEHLLRERHQKALRLLGSENQQVASLEKQLEKIHDLRSQ